MISQQQLFFNVKASPLKLEEYNERLSPIILNSSDDILELSTYGAGPGSVESARSSNTDQSSVDQLSLIPLSRSNYLNASCSKEIANEELTCAVCGDAASGIHYSVVSCNGCKTFFRRTVVTGRKFVCKNNGNCMFDKNKRCSCRACRWKKCELVGMNSGAIQYTPSANLTLSIARKRFQRSLRNPSARHNVQSLQSEQEMILQTIDQVLHLDEKFDRLRSSTFFDYDPKIQLKDLLDRPSVLGDANKYPVVENGKWPIRPPTLQFVDDLNIIQKLGIKFWFYSDIYLSIEYIKTLPVFNQLTTQDKYTLLFDTALKNSYLAAAYFSYTKRVTECLIYPDNTHPFFQKGSNLYELEKVIRRGVAPEMNDLSPDQIQYSLLRAICALNYTCNELSEEGQALISEHCSKYSNSLLRYLQNKHGVQLGTKRFSESMNFIAMICQRVDKNYQYFHFKRCVLQIPSPSRMFNEIMTKRIYFPGDQQS